MANTIDFSHIGFALLTGLVPSLVWLYFWLRRDRNHPEPFFLLTISFLLGSGMVILAAFFQKEVKDMLSNAELRVVVWAGIEEALKFAVFYLVAYKPGSPDVAGTSVNTLVAA